jgi:hypothetical protein
LKKKLQALLWISLIVAFAQALHADSILYPGRDEFSFLRWRKLHGFDTEWKGWEIHLGALLAGDAVVNFQSTKKDSGLRWETAHPLLLGWYDDRCAFHLEPDILGDDTRNHLYQAWIGANLDPAFHLRAGQIKIALDTEFATRAENFPSVDFGFSPQLDGRYDLGLQADGSFWDEALWYEFAAASGHGFELNGRKRSDPQLSLRVVTYPLRWIRYDILKGLFLGASGAWSSSFNDRIVLRTPLRATVFKTPKLNGDRAEWLRFELGWHWGPFWLAYECVEGQIYGAELPEGGKGDFTQLDSWSIYGSWNITGQSLRYNRGRWLPAAPDGKAQIHTRTFDFLNLGDLLGRLELALRYSNADMDRQFFIKGLAKYGPSTQEVRTITVNLNWYPRPGLRFAAGVVETIADQDLDVFDDTDADFAGFLRAFVTF